MIKIEITANEAEQRLDRFLKKYLKRASLGAIYKMIRKDVKINGKRSKEDTMLAEGDILSLYISEERLSELTSDVKRRSTKRQFKIAYEDENVLIVEKPKGLLTHGDAHEKKNTLVNQVCGYLQDKGEYIASREKTFSPAPVNRLDRNTTGLVIFGKNSTALRTLTDLLRNKENIEKYYLTIVCGTFDECLVIEDNLEKNHDKNISRIVDDTNGKVAKSIARPLVTGRNFSLVEVQIFTGRTHQIRVHMASRGYPLVGDSKYGDKAINDKLKELGITTQLLHAYKLVFKNMTGPLEYLNDKVIELPPSSELLYAKKELIE